METTRRTSVNFKLLKIVARSDIGLIYLALNETMSLKISLENFCKSDFESLAFSLKRL